MVTQNYIVNLKVGGGISPIVKLSQGDVGRELAFLLYDGAVRFSPPSGATVKIKGTKPSGLGFNETCTLSGSVARVSTTLAITQEGGNIPAELEITSGSVVIGTANFMMYIEPSPHPDGTTDGTTEEARTVLAQCAQYAQEAQEAAEAASGDYTEIRSDVDDLSADVSQLRADLDDLDEQVDDLRSAIDNIDASLSDTAIQLLETILNAAIYTSDQSANIDALIAELSSGSNVDSITVENGVMTILGLANTPTLSNGSLSIA